MNYFVYIPSVPCGLYFSSDDTGIPEQFVNLFKVKIKNTNTRSVIFVNFEQILQFVLLTPLLIVTKQMPITSFRYFEEEL